MWVYIRRQIILGNNGLVLFAMILSSSLSFYLLKSTKLDQQQYLNIFHILAVYSGSQFSRVYIVFNCSNNINPGH